jgi:flagellar biosynthesis protein FliR
MSGFAPFAALGVLAVRPGMLVITAPPLGSGFAPPFVKIGLSLLLAFALGPIVSLPRISDPLSLGYAVAGEAAVGLALGMGVRAIIAAAELAGAVAGVQAGFLYAAMVDPQSGVRTTVLSSVYGLMATFVFLAIDGHHALLRALVESYARVPVGTVGVGSGVTGAVADIVRLIFVVGIQLVMPVMAALLLVEAALGLASRAAPALNIMMIGFPVRLIVVLLVLAASVGAMPGVVGPASEAAVSVGRRLAFALR